MKSSLRGLAPAVAAVFLAFAPAVLGGVQPAAGATVFHFQPESFAAYQAQLAAGEIHAVTFNKKAHTMHLSMNDHRHLLVDYPPKQVDQLEAAIKAKGVPVAIEKTRSTTTAKPVHHTLRYIAAAVVVIVIVVVVIVLLVGRRRSLADGDSDGDGVVDAPAASD